MSQRNPTQHEIDVYCAQWILNGGDQSKAWRKAYPESKMNDDGVYVKACNMHKMDKVRLSLDQLCQKVSQSDEKEFDISYEAQVKRSLQVFSEGMKPKFDQAGNELAQNLAAAQAAVNEINKMAGHHAATKADINVIVKTPEQRKSRIAELLGKIGG